jgi:hypothetical protein
LRSRSTQQTIKMYGFKSSGNSMKPIMSDNINGFANASISTKRSYDINHFQKKFGHCGQEVLNNTIKMYEFKSSGNFDTCEQCAIAKSRQKNMNKNWLGSSNLQVNASMSISVQLKKEVSVEQSSGLWLLMTTDYCWSFV